MNRIAWTLAASLFALPAFAHEGHDHGQDACRPDMQKFCNDVKPGGGRIIECMNKHDAELSPACKEQLVATEKKREAVKHEWQSRKADWEKACGDDAKKLCPDAKPGHGALAECLLQRKDEVSQSCKDMFSKKTAEHPGMKACMADKEKFCKDIKAGDGRIVDCMKAHKDELSSECRNSFERHRK